MLPSRAGLLFLPCNLAPAPAAAGGTKSGGPFDDRGRIEPQTVAGDGMPRSPTRLPMAPGMATSTPCSSGSCSHVPARRIGV